MVPTPGSELDELNTLLSDPAVQIVARLAKAPIVSGQGVINLADIVECDFPGYAGIPLTPNLDGAFEADFYSEMAPYDVTFEAGVIVSAQSATMLYVTKTAAGVTSLVGPPMLFDPPFLFFKSGQTERFRITVAALADDAV